MKPDTFDYFYDLWLQEVEEDQYKQSLEDLVAPAGNCEDCGKPLLWSQVEVVESGHLFCFDCSRVWEFLE